MARTSTGDGSKPGVRRKKVNHIGYVRDNPVRRGLVSRAVDWPSSSAGLGRLRGCAGEHRPDHPDDGGVPGMMAVRRIRAERSPNRAARLRQEHNTRLARMPPETMRTGLARAAGRGIQACGQAVAHFFGTDHARRRGTRGAKNAKHMSIGEDSALSVATRNAASVAPTEASNRI